MNCKCPSPEFYCAVCNGTARATYKLRQSTGAIKLPAVLTFRNDSDAYELLFTLKNSFGVSDIAYQFYGYLPHRRCFLYLFYLQSMELTKQDFLALLEESGFSNIVEDQRGQIELLKG